jgi:hypothetical protein
MCTYIDELTDAPSICLPNLISMAQLNPANINLLPGVNHSTDCYIECYQNYLVNALDFYDSCTAELDALPAGMCPVITNPDLPLKTMQTYRAQTCCKYQYTSCSLLSVLNLSVFMQSMTSRV